jgi:hypothetical protein
LDDSDQDNGYRDHEQYVDEPTERVRAHHAEQPEHEEHDKDGHQHSPTLLEL